MNPEELVKAVKATLDAEYERGRAEELAEWDAAKYDLTFVQRDGALKLGLGSDCFTTETEILLDFIEIIEFEACSIEDNSDWRWGDKLAAGLREAADTIEASSNVCRPPPLNPKEGGGSHPEVSGLNNTMPPLSE